MLWKPRYKVGTDTEGKPIYKESKFYWIEFTYCGNLIRESTKQTLKTNAESYERRRRRELEDGLAGIKRGNQALTFATAAQDYLEFKALTLTEGSLYIEKKNLTYLLPWFGSKLLMMIKAEDFLKYEQTRLKQPMKRANPKTKRIIDGKRLTSPGTVALEFATFRAIFRRSAPALWALLQPHLKRSDVDNYVGRALSYEEEQALLHACSQSRSKSLLPFVTLLLHTGARFSTVRNLRWCDVDFVRRELRFGKDKTRSGSNRVVPLSSRSFETLKFWACEFPNRQPEHFVFPHQKYIGTGEKDQFGFTGSKLNECNPTRPFSEIKEAFSRAKLKAAQILANDPTLAQPLKLRFHDLRHTAITRMVQAGQPTPVIARLVGWTKKSAPQMAMRYTHPDTEAMRQSLETIDITPKTVQPTEQQPVNTPPQRPN
jgi:integrase